MVVSVDSHYVIGSSHIVCEDYTLSGNIIDNNESKIPYIILCDGCSSAPNTDVGSRINANAVKLSIKQIIMDITNPSLEYIEDLIKLNIQFQLDAGGLSIDTAMSTILFAYVYRNKLYIYVRGDGMCKLLIDNEDLTQTTQLIDFSYTSGAPNYLAYELNNLKSKYKSEFPGVFNMTYQSDMMMNGVLAKDIDYVYYDIIDLVDVSVRQISFTSDGIHSFRANPKITTVNDDFLKMDKLINAATTYGSPIGDFVKRRLMRMEQENIRNGIIHTDDFSVATMLFI